MHACSSFARKSIAMHKLPLFSLLCSSENCTTPKERSMDIGEHHRPSGIITGHFEVVIDHPLSSRPNIFGRSAVYMAGRPKLPAETCLTAAEGRQGMAMRFKQCMHQPHSLSYLWLKGGWASILGPPITHFHAWWSKRPSMHFDFKCNAHTQTKAQSLSLDQGTRHAC